MTQKVFAVRDAKACAFMQPFFSTTRGSALRAFTDVVNDDPARSPIAKHPDDYSLYEIGEFNDQEGQLIPLAIIALIAVGADLVVPKA